MGVVYAAASALFSIYLFSLMVMRGWPSHFYSTNRCISVADISHDVLHAYHCHCYMYFQHQQVGQFNIGIVCPECICGTDKNHTFRFIICSTRNYYVRVLRVCILFDFNVSLLMCCDA